MHPNFAGALLNSALYLLAVFVAGLVTAHPSAWRCAIAAMGVTYISHALAYLAIGLESASLLWLANVVVWLSIVLGFVAGLALLA